MSWSRFDDVLELYQHGQVLDAWELGRQSGPIETWPAVEPKLLAGRIAAQLGGYRLGRLLHLRTFRLHPSDPEAQYYYVVAVLERRGALAAWQSRMALGDVSSDNPRARRLYAGQCATIFALLQDSETAERYIGEALDAAPESARHRVEQAFVFECQDRYPDALAAAREALRLGPRHPAAIGCTARYLDVADRRAEAIELLTEKVEETQAPQLLASLVLLLIETGRLREAEAYLDRFEATALFKERATDDWIADIRAGVSTARGAYIQALRHLESIDSPFHRAVASRLRVSLEARPAGPHHRRLLDVSFVRQHRETCAPATLSAISRYWLRPADHLAVAEAICYDGTSSHSQRRWAEENGWIAREFTVDWRSTVALIDRGIPFVLTLVDAAFGHVQAVVGYDAPLGTIRLRDSNYPWTLEADAAELFEEQASAGPRGLALVPASEGARLADLDLPDAALYDLYHRMHLDLDAHDRDAAVRSLRAMRAVDGSHRLALLAEVAVAAYDRDPPQMLSGLDALLARYQDDPGLQLQRLRVARQLQQRPTLLTWLDKLVKRNPHPALLVEYAIELGADDRQTDEAIWHVRRAERHQPDQAPSVHMLAQLHWQRGDRSMALSLYRFAACLAGLDEGTAHSYFQACYLSGDTEGGLAFLRRRATLLGDRSSQPVRTLFRALEDLERIEEAFVELDAALERHPEDGRLLLFAASKHAQFGARAAAERFLAAAAGRVRHTDWLATAAMQARWRGDRAAALADCYEIVGFQPLDVEAHRQIVVLLSEVSTRERALDHLRGLCRAFPHHAGLHRLLYELTSGDTAASREGTLRQLLEIDPADAWARRELAINLNQQGRVVEAVGEVDESLALDAANASGHVIKGFILNQQGELAKAHACYRTALVLDAAAPGAIYGIIDTTAEAERDDALRLVADELQRQPTSGNGYLVFREVGRSILAPPDLADRLRAAHQGRPDLWQVWAVLAHHLADMGELDEALAMATAAAERFSFLPRCWLDLARVHRARGDLEAQAKALERCRTLNPEWIEAIFESCTALERQGKRDESLRLCESAIARLPLASELRGRLAQLQVRAGDRDRAIATLRETLRIDPSYYAGWEHLVQLSAERGEVTDALDLVRSIAAARTGEAQPWISLGSVQLDAGRVEDALESFDRAIAIDPRAIAAYDHKAEALCRLGRFQEASQACNPDALEGNIPLALRGRAAWTDAQRGDHAGAIEQMNRLIEQSPDYEWGLFQLVRWYADTGAPTEAARIAERLAWLAPQDPIPLGWLGDMLRQSGDTAGAKHALRQAIDLDPSYLFAGRALLELQLAAQEFEAAQHTLSVLRSHTGTVQMLALEVHCAVATRDREAAFERIEKLARHPECDLALLGDAVDLITRPAWRLLLERRLESMLQTEGWNPATPAIWARLAAARDSFGGYRRYQWLASLGKPGALAIQEILEGLGRYARWNQTLWTWFRVRWHLFGVRRACPLWESRDGLYFGKVGYVLVCSARYRALIKWMQDWRDRDDVEPWMLQNLVIALLHRKRNREALATLRVVTERMTAARPESATLLVWCALGACIEGNPAAAGSVLLRIPSVGLPAHLQPLRALVETARSVLQRPPGRAATTSEDRRGVRDVARLETSVESRRLVDLLRVKLGYHARRPWIMFSGWRRAHRGLIIGGSVILFILWTVISILVQSRRV